MFDFIGIIPCSSEIAPEIQGPFDYIEDRVEINALSTHYKLGNNRFQVLAGEEGSFLYENENYSLLLYGDCYIKIGFQSRYGESKISAVGLGKLYEELGDDFINYIKGSFGIIIINHKNKTAKIFNDPLNLKSIFYTKFQNKHIVSSSLTAIAKQAAQFGKELKINKRSVLDHYLFNFILDDQSYLQDIMEMPSGSILELTPQGATVKQYFDPFTKFDLSGAKLDRKEGAARLKEVLAKNIADYNNGPDRTAIALTGGFDSRSVVALLGEDLINYKFYSYGKKGSWDLEIPKEIAQKLSLDYSAILLDETYEKEFSKYGRLAVMLSNGAADFTHANIAYVFSQNFKDKPAILTGLFGSELIKIPSSRGLWLNQNITDLLNAPSPEAVVKNILNSPSGLQALNCLSDYKDAEEELTEMVRNHPYISNDLPINEKYFHYLVMTGIRKYFRREINIQKVWKNNLHPFYDIDFINVLLETPFPWVHHFSDKKDLIKNISIHKLYSELIHTNPALSSIMSTHGYRPVNLLKKYRLPALAYEFMVFKKKISKSTNFHFHAQFAMNTIENNKHEMFGNGKATAENILELKPLNKKKFIQMSSLQYWFNTLGMSL